MANKKSSKAVLFLYEGDTEQGFYDLLFEKLKLNGNLQIKKRCLNGVWNLNKNVAHHIDRYLYNKANTHVKELSVFVAYDREGDRNEPPKMSADEIIKRVKDKRLKGINEIIATKMLESWFFIDVVGIYKFLKVPVAKRNPKKYAQYENYDWRDLAKLFSSFDSQKRYMKGRRTAHFLESLDILKIYESCEDLNKGMKDMLAKIK